MTRIEFLIDQLVNSMEFYTKEDFVEKFVEDCGFNGDKMGVVFDQYWNLKPGKTIMWFTTDWVLWLGTFGINK